MVTSSELKEVLNNSYFEISYSFKHVSIRWRLCKYSDKKRQEIASFDTESMPGYRSVSSRSTEDEFSLNTDDDLAEIDGRKFQVRRISDDIYIQYYADENSKFNWPRTLLFLYNEPVSGVTDLDEMRNYVCFTLIPQV